MKARRRIPFLALLVALPLAAAGVACGADESSPGQSEDEQKRRDSGASRADAADGAGGDGGAIPAPDLGLNDVSILWPAPAEGSLPAGYLKLFPAAGERGPGLPAAAREALPTLHGDLPTGVVRSSLAVIAMRIDPCAPRPSGACVRELRLSAETLSPGLDDAAVHLIYELDDARFRALVGDLETWRSHSPVPTTGRLRVHPGLAAAGIASPFARELHDLVVKYATAAALVRFTAVSFAFDNWGFTRFDRSGSAFEQVDLPGLPSGTPSQAWLRQAMQDNLDDPNGTIDPAPAKSLAALLKTNALAGGTKTAAVLAARDVVLDTENPAKSDATKTDCASCHLADAAHLWSERRGVVFDTPARYKAPAGIDVTVDVRPELAGNASNTIAFGHHRVRHEKLVPSISARVAAESAEVVARLRER